ncbi:MAG TPA: hypothetical protein VGQ02_00635 [Candidatus Limnocylindrales bacterium]|jgi:hypothetical protein|nr:hypothetical protein [Candidatus Limnocylindrales bacterium]
MRRFQATRPVVLSATVIAVVIATFSLFASGALKAVPAPGKADAPPPSARPSVNPTDPPGSPLPTGNADDAADGVDMVDLANWPGVDSTVLVWDESDSLADAVSGSPDREPVGVNVVETAVSADGSIVRLTWSDLPIASRSMLSIRQDDGMYRIDLFRPQPQQPTDNVVSERVLELHFNVAVPVQDVDVRLVESLSPLAGIGLVQSGLTGSNGTGLSVAVWDETDGLLAATIDRIEGDPSVGPDTVVVVNDNADTLRVTWADPEASTSARLSIRMAEDGRHQLRLVRERPQAPTAPAALERVLVLGFHVAVPADDVDVEVIDTMADAG